MSSKLCLGCVCAERRHVDDVRHLTQFIGSRLLRWSRTPRIAKRSAAAAGMVRILPRRDIAALMQPADYRLAVARAFEAMADGLGVSPTPMHIAGLDGGFHVKGAGFGPGELTVGGRAYVAFKVNENFPQNPVRLGLPTIQGGIMLCDGQTGALL
eukprot:gene61326-83882_t